MTDEARAILEKLPEVLRQTPELRHGIFEIIAERFPPREEMARVLEEIRDLREEASRRFEAMDRRFEAMDRRFEAMDRRFEAMDRHFDDVYALLRDVGHKTDVVVGGFTRRAGKGLEAAVAGTLRLALGTREVDPAHIHMRERVQDDKGMIGPAGRSYEYDILVDNGRTWIFEVKSAPDEEDVDRFADKCDLVAHELRLEGPRRVLVTLGHTPELEARCRERGVELL